MMFKNECSRARARERESKTNKRNSICKLILLLVCVRWRISSSFLSSCSSLQAHRHTIRTLYMK